MDHHKQTGWEDLALLARAAWALKWMNFFIPQGIMDRVGILDDKINKDLNYLSVKMDKIVPADFSIISLADWPLWLCYTASIHM